MSYGTLQLKAWVSEKTRKSFFWYLWIQFKILRLSRAYQWPFSLHLPLSLSRLCAGVFPISDHWATAWWPGCICMFGCWEDFLGWSSHLLLLSGFPSIPPASHLSLDAENNFLHAETIFLLWECQTIIFLTHSLWQYGNMSSLVQPDGQQEQLWKQLLCMISCESGWRLKLKKKKKSHFQKIQKLRLQVKLFKMSKVFGREAGVAYFS